MPGSADLSAKATESSPAPEQMLRGRRIELANVARTSPPRAHDVGCERGRALRTSCVRSDGPAPAIQADVGFGNTNEGWVSAWNRVLTVMCTATYWPHASRAFHGNGLLRPGKDSELLLNNLVMNDCSGCSRGDRYGRANDQTAYGGPGRKQCHCSALHCGAPLPARRQTGWTVQQ